MDHLAARQLLNKLESGSGHRLTAAVKLDDNVRKILGARAAGGASDAPLLALMEGDRVAWDAKTLKLIASESKIEIDKQVRPNDKSAQFDDGIEQCMEFVMRYFRTQMQKDNRPTDSFGGDWKSQHNIAAEVRQMANGSLNRPGYTAYLAGGSVPPRAGDILSFESAEEQKVDGEAPNFHVALVESTFKRDGKWFVRVYEANVPLQVNHPDIEKHFEDIELKVSKGKFSLKRVETSKLGYETDMDAVGWIHPLGHRALPGAVAKLNVPGTFGFDGFTSSIRGVT